MASLSIDPSSALAEKYRGNRQVLEAAVLGRGGDASIDPYSALRALQKLNVADRYEMMQKAMQGQPNPPSIAQQTVAQAQSGGLGAMPVPEQTFNMAGGGLVAFADGGDTDLEFPTTFSPEDIAYGEEYAKGYQEKFGPEEYYRKREEELAQLQEMGPEELQQQRGLAALQAAAALSQGNDLVRGLGAAGSAFGQSYGTALKEAKREKRSIAQARAEMEDARRKEEAALYKDKQAAVEQAFGRRTQAAEYALKKAQLEAEREQASATAAAAANKPQNYMNQMLDSYRADELYKWADANPDKTPTKKDLANIDARAADRLKQVNVAEGRLAELQKQNAEDYVKSKVVIDLEWMNATPERRAVIEQKYRDEYAGLLSDDFEGAVELIEE
jgi:hypothetical protein